MLISLVHEIIYSAATATELKGLGGKKMHPFLGYQGKDQTYYFVNT